ncbi:MAG: cytochrome c3 family protein [Bacteroidales bacterium]|nr:cytochrome c3 family protein [Bacteroidales bacterium]
MRRISSLSFSLSFLILFLFPPASASGIQEEHGTRSSAEGLMRGERLFYGLIDGKFETKACADCHNTVEIDTFNWNPSAFEIAIQYRDKSLDEFRKAVLNPVGVTMGEMHRTFHLNESDVEMIKLYLDDFSGYGLSKTKPVINKIFLFILLGVVLTWVILDIFFFKKVKRRYILGIIFFVALGWQAKLLYEAGTSLGRQELYEPDQPLKFSHVVHASDNRIDCRYCHSIVDQSRHAGIPGVDVCWNCHSIVREGSYSGKHQISKVVDAYEQGTSLAWIRVHNLPEHVYFSHAQHVNIGEIECAACHGAVEEMDRVRQVGDLSMGWCINCHRDTGVQFFDNQFYKQYKELHRQMESGEIDRVTAELTGGTECSKCHY